MNRVSWPLNPPDPGPAEFDQLVGRWSGPLRNYLWNRCGDRQDAEDLVQEVFLLAWSRGAQLLDPQAAGAWLFKTALNMARRVRRRESVQQRLLGQRVDLQPEVASSEMPEPFVGRLADALRSLGQEDGRLVLLVAVHGYGFREVAEQLNLSEDVARKRWQRARARLFAQLPAAAPDAPGIPRRPSGADLKEPLR
ncbi:MAG: RNA polymerase sigma factor [Anaerolineae bacterium]